MTKLKSVTLEYTTLNIFTVCVGVNLYSWVSENLRSQFPETYEGTSAAEVCRVKGMWVTPPRRWSNVG